jgi:hypothetical protein
MEKIGKFEMIKMLYSCDQKIREQMGKMLIDKMPKMNGNKNI